MPPNNPYPPIWLPFSALTSVTKVSLCFPPDPPPRNEISEKNTKNLLHHLNYSNNSHIFAAQAEKLQCRM